ncbi:catalase family peroxidase [Paraburkholderia sp. J41]|uniref:catalase family peroxidase n=1 Tax=Paraburkholderia sp. J41 TaxID=2805433 RepID=UPI002AC32A9D|nr:catalase family peroxidase [Paraburkholderia sp. J41]
MTNPSGENVSPRNDSGIYSPAYILSRANFGSLIAIGAVLVVVAAAFAWTAGWLSPKRLTPGEVVDQFERTNGLHAGFRRNHPKGICFAGHFDSSGAGQTLSKAEVFRPWATPVFGRFAIASGQPYLPDTAMSVRSMALNFTLRNGEVWRMAMNGIPVFTVASVQDLYDQLVAATPDPKTGKPDPARLAAFMKSHPADAQAVAVVKATPLASGFANTTFNSLDAFLFVNARGDKRAVRWAMIPDDPFQPAKPDLTQATRPNFQFDDLITRMRLGPIRYHLVVTLGQPGDQTTDPSKAWPPDRDHIDLGVLTLDRVDDEAHGACRDVNFDPLILPAGVEASDDPILSARSATYAQSFKRRAAEHPPVSAVHLPSNSEGMH